MSLQRIKLITFDATNTLLKFRVPPWQHYMVVARDYGFSGSEHDVKKNLFDSFKVMNNKYPNFGKSKIDWTEWWTKVVSMTFKGQIPEQADTERIAKQLIDEFKTCKCWCVAEGAESLLCLLRDRGFSLGVISNTDPRLNDVLKNTGLNNYIDFVMISYECGYSKPDENIFKIALKKCPSKPLPEESLHIGDDYHKDFKGAKAAGWRALLVNEENLLKNETPPANHLVFKNLDKIRLAIESNQLML